MIASTKYPMRPWQNAPYSLISWWAMLNFSAHKFLRCGWALQSIRHDCIISSYIGGGDEPAFDLSQHFDEHVKHRASTLLVDVEAKFRNLGLRITADTTKELACNINDPSHKRSIQWLIDQIEAIQKLFNKELSQDTFFFVPSERAKYFPAVDDPHIFGESVANVFPDASFDIAEAGKCLALARGTACVFHLMRVLEMGLAVLGKKFDVSSAHTNWSPVISEIESKIRKMHEDQAWKNLPDCKEQQESYAQIASHFGILKDAWRNHTMHARGVYTVEDAELMFDNVKAFMQKLAKRFTE